MSLDRLIHLAQRTGDRLIVHDRYGTDVVIMDIDGYEDLIDRIDTCKAFHAEEPNDHVEESEGQEHRTWDSVADVLDQKFDEYAEPEQESPSAAHFDEDYFTYGDRGIEPESSVQHEGDMPREAMAAHDDIPEPLPQNHIQRPPVALSHDSSSSEFEVEEVPQEVPFVPREGGDWEEEPLEDTDEPMFYEEPV